jgi:hypothetical protein
MSHWRKQFADEKTIGAHDLEVDGKFGEMVVTIEKFYQGELVGSMGKENKVFAKLKEFAKPMIVNRTNFKRLEKLFNSFDMEQYLNKPVKLIVEQVKSPEGIVPALRFSSRSVEVPAAAKALPSVKPEDFGNLMEMVTSGKMSIADVQSKRLLTPQQLKELQDAVVQG